MREAESYLPDCCLGKTQKDGLLVYLRALPACWLSNSCSSCVSHLLWYRGASAQGGPEQSLGLETVKKMWPPPTPKAAGSGETDAGVTRTNDGPARTAVLKGQLLTQPRCDSHQMEVKDGDRAAGHPGTGWPAGFWLAGLGCPCPCSSFTLGNVRGGGPG